MRRISLFVEDFGHEEFLRALLCRLAREEGIPLEIEVRNASGGHGRAIRELREFVRELRAGASALPDLLVVAVDANCKGYGDRRKEIDGAVGELKDWTVCAVPDPHVERWLLVDSAAFKAVLGRGCSAPDQKCDRDRYKQLLRAAVSDAGLSPLFGMPLNQ
jgi:hypothetical protein